MTGYRLLAIACWAAAWFLSGLPIAAAFAAIDRKYDVALMEFATGVLGAIGFVLIGRFLW